MSLPIILPVGTVSLYGIGTSVGIIGWSAPTGSKFAYVDTIYDGAVNFNVGDSVLFKEADVLFRLTYGNAIYTFLEEAKLVLTEQLPP